MINFPEKIWDDVFYMFTRYSTIFNSIEDVIYTQYIMGNSNFTIDDEGFIRIERSNEKRSFELSPLEQATHDFRIANEELFRDEFRGMFLNAVRCQSSDPYVEKNYVIKDNKIVSSEVVGVSSHNPYAFDINKLNDETITFLATIFNKVKSAMSQHDENADWVEAFEQSDIVQSKKLSPKQQEILKRLAIKALNEKK